MDWEKDGECFSAISAPSTAICLLFIQVIHTWMDFASRSVAGVSSGTSGQKHCLCLIGCFKSRPCDGSPRVCFFLHQIKATSHKLTHRLHIQKPQRMHSVAVYLSGLLSMHFKGIRVFRV